VSIGVAASKPNWVSLSESPVFIGIPIMENITHTAKHAVKAVVFITRTEIACLFSLAIVLTPSGSIVY
jgi:hypothetical protein